MEKTKIEAWLDGYDQRKNDLLAWVNDGGEVAVSVAALVPKLEAAIREIRNKAQAEAALADLAAVEAAIDGVREVAPTGTSMASPVPAAAPPQPASVSEGILGALSFMDQKFPASTPAGSSDSDRRNKTSPLPAVFDLLKSSGGAAAPSAPVPSTSAPAPTPPAPTPAPTPSPAPTLAPAPAAPSLSEASATRRDPLDVFDRVLSLSNAPRSAPPPPVTSAPP